MGWRELLTAGLGVLVSALAAAYALRVFDIVVRLEEHGELVAGSLEWALLVCAVASERGDDGRGRGRALLWWGAVRSQRLAEQTDYMVTGSSGDDPARPRRAQRGAWRRRGRGPLARERRALASLPGDGRPRGEGARGVTAA